MKSRFSADTCVASSATSSGIDQRLFQFMVRLFPRGWRRSSRLASSGLACFRSSVRPWCLPPSGPSIVCHDAVRSKSSLLPFGGLPARRDGVSGRGKGARGRGLLIAPSSCRWITYNVLVSLPESSQPQVAPQTRWRSARSFEISGVRSRVRARGWPRPRVTPGELLGLLAPMLGQKHALKLLLGPASIPHPDRFGSSADRP